MSMAESIEMRVPFLDSRMIDFGIHAPLHAKLRRGKGKCVIKQAAKGYLPREIIHAEKIGFGINSSMWDHSEQFLRGGVLAELFKWDSQTLNELIESITGRGLLVFHLVSMELWARLFLTGENSAQLSEELVRLAEESA